MTALAGRATPAGTTAFAHRLSPDGSAGSKARSHFGALGDLCISSVGFGLAAGDPTDEVDQRYRAAIAAAVAAGCNHFDVALSYRDQRSEVVLGRAVTEMVGAGEIGREELIIASKAGFLSERFTSPGIVDPDDLAGGIHCMAPNFLSQQISWSLRNMGLRSIDIYYIQNPETQLSFVDRATFRRRLQLAFARLEEEVAAARIGCYGIATWDALRLAPFQPGYMSLEVALRLVTEVAGPNHHLRVIQLPLNLSMTEAVTLRNQPVKSVVLPLLTAASDLGLTVITSAALGQGQLSVRTQESVQEAFGSLGSPGQRSLQFVRSLPGVASVLFGSTSAAHVTENLAVLMQPIDSPAALRLAHMKGR